MNREGNSNQMVSEQRSEESEYHLDVWGKTFNIEGSVSQNSLKGEHARCTQDNRITAEKPSCLEPCRARNMESETLFSWKLVFTYTTGRSIYWKIFLKKNLIIFIKSLKPHVSFDTKFEISKFLLRQ